VLQQALVQLREAEARHTRRPVGNQIFFSLKISPQDSRRRRVKRSNEGKKKTGKIAKKPIGNQRFASGVVREE
jgi:hypothetical protein